MTLHAPALAAFSLGWALGTAMAAPAPPAPNASSSTPTTRDSVCEQLAQRARGVKDAVWKDGEQALGDALVLELPYQDPTPLTNRLAQLPAVEEASVNEVGPYFEHLPGTDVFMAVSVGGTAHCQNAVFLDAKSPETARVIERPARNSDHPACWVRSGDLGRVLGQPAYVEHGTIDDHTLDIEIAVTPWTGVGWGPSCRTELSFKDVYRVAETFCGDQNACAVGSRLAVTIATAYNRQRRRSREGDDFHFVFSPKATEETIAAVARAKASMGSKQLDTPAFPTFGAVPVQEQQSLTYSYAGFSFFPFVADGLEFVGAVGHAGYGWREGGPTLFAIYSADADSLRPLAGYVIEVENAGLREAIAE